MKEQGRRLMDMINTALEGLNDLGPIVPAVQDLGRRHAGYGVQNQHYEAKAKRAKKPAAKAEAKGA